MKLGRVLLGTACCAATINASAQSYPDKAIRLLLPFPTGGTFLVGHLVSEGLAPALGKPVVAENRVGAGGSVAMEAVAKSTPDGYTLMVATPTLTITPNIRSSLRYDPMRDLIPIGAVAKVPNVMTVHPSVPAGNLTELIRAARAHPGKLTFGTSGMGSSLHLASELFSVQAKLTLQHVPYQSGTQALNALVGGQVDMAIGGQPTATPLILAGRLRAVAVLTAQRAAALPHVATVVEQGMPELVVDTWYGVVGPRGLRAEIVTQLHRELTRLVSAPDTQKKMAKMELEPFSLGLPEFTDYIRADFDKWQRVIREANLKFD